MTDHNGHSDMLLSQRRAWRVTLVIQRSWENPDAYECEVDAFLDGATPADAIEVLAVGRAKLNEMAQQVIDTAPNDAKMALGVAFAKIVDETRIEP